MTAGSAFLSWGEVDNWLGGLADLEQLRGAARSRFVRKEQPVQQVLERVGAWPYPLPMLHLVGSKGKGSTALYCEQLSRRAGLRTGLYQSPHLVDRRERILLDGKPASWSWWAEALAALSAAILEEGLSRFEAETAVAFWIFLRADVDVVICEAGVGGVGDATAAVPAQLVCLTSVEREHTDLLGDDIAGIALQKAGVVGEQGVLAVGPLPQDAMRAILGLCRERGARCLEVGVDVSVVETEPTSEGTWVTIEAGERGARTQHRFFLSAFGAHQPYMAALAILATKTFFRQILGRAWSWSWLESLGEVSLPGRLQQLGGIEQTILLDTAHTPRSIRASLEACRLHKHQDPACILLGLSEDKAVIDILSLAASVCRILLLVPTPGPRGCSMELLEEVAKVDLPVILEIYPDVESGLVAFQQHLLPQELGLITGSFRLAGAVLAGLGGL
ncbi:MAG: hypothetical protein H6727_17440 [Myxococcales bacterium]|nr:hypothetical protein [Myxococcales bacterium]